MRPFFSALFHARFRKPRVILREDVFPTGPLYKEYSRFPSIELPRDAQALPSLSETLATRTSADAFADRALRKDEVGGLLAAALALREDGKRPYPSGGGLYPVETYAIIRSVTDIPEGVYHYHPKRNALELLIAGKIAAETFMQEQHIAMGERAPLALVMTAVWPRNSGKYGEGAYQLGLLEAGHAMQNILLCAEGMGLCARPFAGFVDEGLEELLDIDPKVESTLYVALIGGRHFTEQQ